MIEFYEELEPVDPDHLVQGELRSEVMFKEDKKYHVDLKVKNENKLELFEISCINLSFIDMNKVTNVLISIFSGKCTWQIFESFWNFH